jgi:hypothetical protein
MEKTSTVMKGDTRGKRGTSFPRVSSSTEHFEKVEVKLFLKRETRNEFASCIELDRTLEKCEVKFPKEGNKKMFLLNVRFCQVPEKKFNFEELLEINDCNNHEQI